MEPSEEQLAYDEAVEYLVDLLRSYGHRAIIYYFKDGEPVEIMARNYIRKQLVKDGILFPINSDRKPSTRSFNFSLDREKLTVIFHDALYDLEEAYIDLHCQDSNSNSFVNKIYDRIRKESEWIIANLPAYTQEELDPFPETPPEVIEQKQQQNEEDVANAKQVLSEYGIEKTDNIVDLNSVFWKLAYLHKPITKAMKRAILEISSDRDFSKKILDINRKTFNSQIAVLEETVHNGWEDKANHLKQQVNEYAENKKEFRRKIQELRDKYSGNKKVAKLLFRYLVNPNSGIFKSYNMENEEDQEQYIQWFKLQKRRLSNPLRGNIEQNWKFSSEALESFKTKVSQYNDTLLGHVEANDDDD